MDVKLGQYVDLALDAGKLSLSVDLDVLIKPSLVALKAKVDSGAIDLIKGTDIDKELLDKVLDQAIAAL